MNATKKITLALLALLSCSALGAQETEGAAARVPSWKLHDVDGHRTGVTAPTDTNIPEALGTVSGRTYKAPNGKVYRGGVTPDIVRLVTDAQPAMAPVKEVIGYSTTEMLRYRPQCELSNWFTDFLRAKTAELTGKTVDVAIYNFGGIRTDMPQGPVTVDDILSMFPFKNSLCYVALKGSDLRAIFNFMARTGVQAFSGAKVVIKDRKVQSIEIGGKPLDDKAVYGVATINFLLAGGDGLYIAKNAVGLIDSGVYVKDAILPYVRRLTAESTPIEYHLDDRITILGDEDDNK